MSSNQMVANKRTTFGELMERMNESLMNVGWE